jgi:pilus assembly protein Flp/PilA
VSFLRSLVMRSYFAVARLRRREEGQAMVEYALILFLVSVASIAVLTTLGGSVSTLFSKVNVDF